MSSATTRVRSGSETHRGGAPANTEAEAEEAEAEAEEGYEEQWVEGYRGITLLSKEPVPRHVPKRTGKAKPLIQLAVWGGTVLAFGYIASIFALL